MSKGSLRSASRGPISRDGWGSTAQVGGIPTTLVERGRPRLDGSVDRQGCRSYNDFGGPGERTWFVEALVVAASAAGPRTEVVAVIVTSKVLCRDGGRSTAPRRAGTAGTHVAWPVRCSLLAGSFLLCAVSLSAVAQPLDSYPVESADKASDASSAAATVAAPGQVTPPQGTRPAGPGSTVAPTAPSGAVGAEGGTTTRGNGPDMRLRVLEEQVDELKERVYRSKSRLMLLREQVLHNAIAEARAMIVHENEMGAFFDLVEVLYFLDGERVFYRADQDGDLADLDEIEVFNGSVTPGNHILSVELVYRGDGGIFSYVDGYSFSVKSTYTFQAKKGRITRVGVVGYERGGITTELQDKPTVRYEVEQYQYNKKTLESLANGEQPQPVQTAEDQE